jgi:hypothetical protein
LGFAELHSRTIPVACVWVVGAAREDEEGERGEEGGRV